MEDSIGYPTWKKAIVGGVLEPITLRLASAVYCVCEHGARRPKVRRHARTNLGVIHNGVPLPSGESRDWDGRRALGFSDQDVVALCVCRVSVDKGLLVLAEALHHLEGVGASQPKLLLVGDGPDVPRIKAAFGSLVQRGRVVMLGHRKDIPKLHALSDLFVLPTLHENLSMAILEAMAAGRAVLATEVGGNPELVEHRRSGLLVPVQDSGALAKGLENLVASGQLRREMGQAGRARIAAAFSVERLASRLAQVYEGLLSGRLL
jgi:glycosyltransferase involved in cell wall biosynthesis